MCGLQHEMPAPVDDGTFTLGITSPQDENQPGALCGQILYDGISKLLPSLPLMASCQMLSDGKGGIQQQYALSRPAAKAAIGRRRSTQVILYLLEDIDKRGGRWHSFCYREAKSFCLSSFMIGILPYDDHLDSIEGAEVEGREDLFAWRIASAAAVFLAHEICELCEVWLLELFGEHLCPGCFYSYHLNRMGRGKDNG